MADRTNLVHVQAANGLWVWVPTSELEAWKKKQDKIRAGLSPEENRRRAAGALGIARSSPAEYGIVNGTNEKTATFFKYGEHRIPKKGESFMISQK